MRKHHLYIGLFVLLVLASYKINAQLGFPELLKRAKSHSAELVSLEASKTFLELEASRIKAEHTAPKVYVSSEFLFAPYFSNNGELISTTPQSSAIGYDAGVTNGGLYSFLLNAEMPILNHKQVENLLEQNNAEILRIENSIHAVAIELSHTLALRYLDVLSAQAKYRNIQENKAMLEHQLAVAKSLTEYGKYKYVDFRLLEAAYNSNSIDLETSEVALQIQLNEMRAICGIEDTCKYQVVAYNPELNRTSTDSSVFLQGYIQDSISGAIQQKVFENQYKPQVSVYANTGLNSTSLANMGNHLGMSAGIQLSYTLFDGKQKQINQLQQMTLINGASKVKELKLFEVEHKKSSYLKAISLLSSTIEKEAELQKDYDDILSVYTEEVQNAQASIIDYLNFLQLYNQNKLSLEKHKIERSKLVVEYNYWNN